jgi:4-amino-4-deoxy-L-arabinose transferase-like glycosyltransferase
MTFESSVGMREYKQDILILAFLLMLALYSGFFLNIGSLPLFDVDEGAFCQATREMFLRNDFISTYLNNQPRYDKPILTYWLQAASITLFGVSEFSFRLPSALAASLWAGVILLFTRRVTGDWRLALLAALFMVTSLAVAVIGKAAIADALLNLLLSGAMGCLYLYFREQQNKWLYAAAAFSGLGVLTKGPIALLIPGAVSLLYCLSRGEFRLWLLMVAQWRAWLIAILIAGPWYIIQYVKEGSSFISGFLLKHNVGRFQQPMEGHSGPLWYYLPVLLIAILPYTTLLLNLSWKLPSLTKEPLQRYLLIWFGFVLVFFSLAATKLPHYLIYGLPPLFILMTVHWPRQLPAWLLLLPSLLMILLLLALPALVELSQPRISDSFVREMLAGIRFPSSYYIWLALILTGLGYFMIEHRLASYYKVAIAGLLLNIFIAAHLLPIIAEMQQQPVKEAAMIARQYSQTPVMWRLNMPSFSVYSDRLVERRPPHSGDLVLTKARNLQELGPHQILYQRNGIALALLLP